MAERKPLESITYARYHYFDQHHHHYGDDDVHVDQDDDDEPVIGCHLCCETESLSKLVIVYKLHTRCSVNDHYYAEDASIVPGCYVLQ